MKYFRSPDCFLKIENMKKESLVIVEQYATVKRFPSLVHTARRALGFFIYSR